MPRKRCCGLIDEYPVCRKFLSTHTEPTNSVVLALEEMESVRLKDLEGLDQEQCAKAMNLTRPTFQRLLASARFKITSALVNGQTIIIEGGHYQVKNRVFECLDCGEVWEVGPCSEGGKHGYEIACPKCGSMKKTKIVDGERHACGGAGHHGHENGGCGCGNH